jgi:hypothetical protein
MTIPHFKSQHDWEAFTQIFDSQWHCKLALLNRVKDDMFPGFEWHSLTPKSIETINDIVTSLLYDVDRKFKETHQDYKTEDDELFIPYRSFKENVAEALLEANQKFWNSGNLDCPPCDTLTCADHLTDE